MCALFSPEIVQASAVKVSNALATTRRVGTDGTKYGKVISGLSFTSAQTPDAH